MAGLVVAATASAETLTVGGPTEWPFLTPLAAAPAASPRPLPMSPSCPCSE
jgi:hypothetical protein